MNFKQYVLDNANKKYSEMYDGVSKNPIKVDTKLADYSTYDKKRLDYNNRLSQERRDYNNALESVITVRDARVKREKDIAWQIAEKKKARQFAIKQVISTLFLLLPTLLLLVGGLIIVVNPIPVFKLINFWIVIAIYAVALIGVIIASVYIIKNYEYSDSLIMHKGKAKAIMLIVCGVLATFVMAFGMINVGNLTVEISSADDFILMKNLPGAGRCDYQLKNDIDCHGKTPDGWGSIGKFSGTFDGKNYSIKNLKVESKSAKLKCGEIYVSEAGESNESSKVNGFGFVQMNNGAIKNVRFDQIDMVSEREGYQFIGIIAAYNEGTINNCLVTNCTITVNSTSSGRCYVGGIVGYDNSGEISNVAFVNTEDHIVFNIKGERCYFGGIAGESYAANIKNAYVYQIDKDLDRYGGIIGVAEALENGRYDVPAYLTNCVNCFAPSSVYAYGESVRPLVNESNVFTSDTLIKELSDLPSEVGRWTYIADLNCYVPCSNFK